MSRQSSALWRLTEGFRGQYLSAILALAAGTFAGYLGPLVTRTAVDGIVAVANKESLPAAGLWQHWFAASSARQLWVPAAAIVFFAIISGVCMYAKGRWAAHASEGVIRRLRERIYDHLQHLPCNYFDNAETGDLVQRCTSDVETVRLFLATQVVEIGRALLLLLTVIPIMVALDLRMTLVSLAGTPFIVAFSVLFFRTIRPRFLAMDEAEGRMTAVLQENLTGIRVVRAFARQDFEIEKFSERVGDYRDRHYRLIQILAGFWTLSDLMVFFQQAAVLVAGAYWIIRGELSVGTLVAFLLFVNIFIWPIRQSGRILADLGKAVVAYGRIQEILAVPAEQETAVRPPAALEGRVEFEDVSFSYGGEDQALDDVSFVIEPGETLAIVGPSGAGKSTVIQLLLRLYDGARGRITIDGIPLEELPRKWLRDRIAVIMQEPFLFSKSVGQNIGLGRRDAVEGEILEAANAAFVHDAIAAFPEGYDTQVGERGVTLSGGQRQRVALARALLQRPAILALDDALSAVDTETESLILDSLRQRHGRQTTLIIAHRLSTLRYADRVLVLDRGRVEQWGTHESLRDSEGVYRRIWALQAETGQTPQTGESASAS